MKRTIFGSFFLLAGILSTALLLSGTLSSNWTLDGTHSAIWTLSCYGLLPALFCFVAIAVIGTAVALWGMTSEHHHHHHHQQKKTQD